MCYYFCCCLYIVLYATGISLPDDIQLSLTAEETDPNAEAGSPDSQLSANRMNEAGCVFHH